MPGSIAADNAQDDRDPPPNCAACGLPVANNKLILLLTAAFAAVFTVFDIAEFVHQIDRSEPGLVVLAAIIAVIHAGAALLATQRSTANTLAAA